jgi:hypothetical protein
MRQEPAFIITPDLLAGDGVAGLVPHLPVGAAEAVTVMLSDTAIDGAHSHGRTSFTGSIGPGERQLLRSINSRPGRVVMGLIWILLVILLILAIVYFIRRV